MTRCKESYGHINFGFGQCDYEEGHPGEHYCDALIAGLAEYMYGEDGEA